jgi:Family of unknown function (DUF6174)
MRRLQATIIAVLLCSSAVAEDLSLDVLSSERAAWRERNQLGSYAALVTWWCYCPARNFSPVVIWVQEESEFGPEEIVRVHSLAEGRDLDESEIEGFGILFTVEYMFALLKREASVADSVDVLWDRQQHIPISATIDVHEDGIDDEYGWRLMLVPQHILHINPEFQPPPSSESEGADR